MELQRCRDEWKEDDSFPLTQRKAAVEATHHKMHQLRDNVEAAQKLMRDELRLVGEN